MLCVLTGLLALLPGMAPRAASQELYFSDDFTGSGDRALFEGRLDQRVFRYTGGEYEIDTSATDAYGQSVLLDDLGTYRLEVTGRMISAGDPQNSGFGVSFNYHERTGTASKPASDFLLFLVYDRGAYTVLRYKDGQTSVLYSPTKTQLVKPGVKATLTVDAVKGSLTMYLNGVQVAQLREDSLVSGGYGLFTTGHSVARFDDFKVFADRPKPAGQTDDFSGEKKLFEGSWGEVNYVYDSGRYLIDTMKTKFIGLSPFPDEAQDFELAVDVELVNGDPSSGYGVYIRDYKGESGGFNQFRFLVSGGWYAVEQSIEERPIAVSEWAEHSSIQAGGVNRLKITAKSGDLAYFINGVEVWHGEDSRPHRGAYGLFCSAGIEVAFDNFSFTKL